MGDPKGFLKVTRETSDYRPVCERVKDYKDVVAARSDAASIEQASRCMDCGTPFCHSACPVGNYIPEWNDLVYRKQWKQAYELLAANNNFPEFTGRLCPALCEYACVLGINDDAVTIREDELAIIEHAFKAGYVTSDAPKVRTGKKVAVVGSGPAGLAAADQLNKAGHTVTVFEKDEQPGGILRFGIPDFKIEKSVVSRRIDLLRDAGVTFTTKVNVGVNMTTDQLLKNFDAICLSGGSRTPRDMKIEGRELDGIYFAMDYLMQTNRKICGETFCYSADINAKGKKVLVIGGGDTGSDCVGTANRQGASCVKQIEVMPQPGEVRPEGQDWPKYPTLLKTTSSHEEGVDRQWAILTKKFEGANGKVTKVHCVKADFSQKDAKGSPVMKEVAGSEFIIEADIVVLAIGFLHPEHGGLIKNLALELDARGNVKTDEKFMTSVKKVFAAGDMRRGQSLVVWAISEGRKAARFIDEYLMGKSSLPVI